MKDEKESPTNLIFATCGFQFTPLVSFQSKSYKVSMLDKDRKTVMRKLFYVGLAFIH